jgi:hypothetical protein
MADHAIKKIDELLLWKLLAQALSLRMAAIRSVSMQKKTPQAPELKALLAQLQTRMSPKKRLRVRAAMLVTEIIAQVQRQSRLGK